MNSWAWFPSSWVSVTSVAFAWSSNRYFRFMNASERAAHWQSIYSSKPLESCSWYQPVPQTSLDLIAQLGLPHDAPILDVGGGDALLVDHLLDRGYTNLTVLDISANAIARAQARLGTQAASVHWVVSDVTTFQPEQPYALWHDRAAFHFLTSVEDLEAYHAAMQLGTATGSKAIVATFSTNGPMACSGTKIQQYDPAALAQALPADWHAVDAFQVEHTTPSGGIQEFTFGVFGRS